MSDEFIRAYEDLVREIERVVAQYPAEMREDLRAHARRAIDRELRALWGARSMALKRPSLN